MEKRLECIKKGGFFKAYQVNEYATVIKGLAGEVCYLVEGAERALLIDTLCGEQGLRSFVSELTSLPVTVAVTHGHLDHIGGCAEYGECLIHPSDIAMCYEDQQYRKDYRKWFISKGYPEIKDEEITDGAVLKTYPINDGDVIDLGGVSLQVIAVPGHTWGSVCFLDKKSRILFSGDACNVNTLLDLVDSAPVSVYRKSMQYLKTYEADIDVLYGGHGLSAVPVHIIDEAIELCTAILEKRDDHVEIEGIVGGRSYIGKKRRSDCKGSLTNEDGTICNIVYRDHNLMTDGDERQYKGYPVKIRSKY